MRQAGEPTVEEILESIKKVIARDNRAVGDTPARKGLAADPAPHAEDVLELSEDDTVAEEDSFDQPGDEGEAPLLNDDSRASMRDTLAALSMLAQPGAAPQIVRSGETSLEGLARELLRPALAEWLERNLPPLVERMVAAEIARIVSKRG